MKSKLTDLMFILSEMEPFNPAKSQNKKILGMQSVFYQDNSMDKSDRAKQKFLQKQAELPGNIEKLKQQSEVKLSAQKARIFQEKLEEIVTDNIGRYYKKKSQLENAAIKIQKIIRGYLARRRFDEIFCESKEKELKLLNKSLGATALKCFLNYGTNIIEAVKKIQRMYRNSVLSTKVKKLTDFYQVITSLRRKNAENASIVMLKILTNKFRTLQQVELVHKYRVLKRIREKLALMSIAKYWKKRRFNYRVLREKILKAKRRFLALRNREAYQRQLSCLDQKIEDRLDGSSSKLNDDDAASISDEEIKKIQLEKRRKKQIKEELMRKIKLSHNVNEIKLASFSPFLLVESESCLEEPKPRMMPTQCSLIKAKGKLGPLDTRRTQILNPIKMPHKRYYYPSLIPDYFSLPQEAYAAKTSGIKIPAQVADSNFLKDTFASSIRVNPIDYELKFPVVSVVKPKRNYMKYETMAFTMKKRERARCISENKWKIHNHDDEKYMPSINNMSYTPQPFAKSSKKPKDRIMSLNSNRRSKFTLLRNKNEWSSSLVSMSPSTMEASTVDLLL